MESVRRFTSQQYTFALEAWAFLPIEGKRPGFSSLFGDVFLESTDGWWFLDIVSGTLTHEWSSEEERDAALNTPEGQDQFLMVGLARRAAALGVLPNDDQVLSFVVPPVLGGPVAEDNLSVADMVVTVDLSGQIHEQVRNLPPGTPVTGFTIG